MSTGSDSKVSTRPKRNTYCLKTKLEVIKYAEKTGNKSKAARDLKLSRKNIEKWAYQKAKIEAELATPSTSRTPSKNLKGAGRPAKNIKYDKKMMKRQPNSKSTVKQ